MFHLKDDDIPDNFKEYSIDLKFRDYLAVNILRAEKFNKINKAMYLQKMKLNIDN